MAIRDTIGRFLGLEKRAAGSSYTNQVLDASSMVAFSDTLAGHHTQSMVDAARRCARAISRGKLETEGTIAEWVQDVLTPAVVADVIEAVVLNGNYLAEIDLDRGLVRPVKYEVQGASVDPGSWRYVVEFNTPTGKTRRRTLQAAAVAHVLVNADPAKPWQGCGFFDRLGGYIDLEARMADLASLPVQRFITTPGVLSSNAEGKRRSRGVYADDQEGSRADKLDGLSSTHLKKGGIIRVRNTGSRGGPEEIPVKDLTPAPSQNAVELRRQLVAEVYEAVGYPPALRSESAPGQTVRAAYAAWVDAFLTPLADDVAMQLSESLETNVRFDMSQVRLSSRVEDAQILKSLAGAGVALPDAMGIAGLTGGGKS